jgi:hypothetical protein
MTVAPTILRNRDIIPADVTWEGWLAFAEEIFSGMSSEPRVNSRFYYGELRLDRLNWVYRLTYRNSRGYLIINGTYGEYLRDNFNLLITFFTYTTIVLSAMQGGLSTEIIRGNQAFEQAAFAFTLFAIRVTFSVIGAITVILAVLFVRNLLSVFEMQRRQGVGL